jgi:serine/threonine protein kinase
MRETLPEETILQERYQIIKVLGKGSFGVVYQARDTRHPASNELVAIKEMPMQMIINCERQADLRATLLHPAIPRIHDYLVHEDNSYLVQEFIQGKNLEIMLQKEDAFLPEETIIAWAIELCDVLNYLHTHQFHPMIFRDIKPSNIMADPHGNIHLIDFGLARAYPPGFFLEPAPQFEHLQKGLRIGTEGYSPPEQYEGIVEPKSDIYALGATLHHLLTRRDPRVEPPFTFEDCPVRSINPDVSEELEAIVMKAVQNDMDKRFSSALEMKLALEVLANRASKAR